VGWRRDEIGAEGDPSHRTMRVLITGGAGFIGSHLAEAYVARGDEVFVIDDLSTGSLQNVAHLKDRDGFHLTVDSVLNREALLHLVHGCDVVAHLAAAVGVRYIIEHPLSAIETNVRGTEIVLELAAKFQKKVLIASTSEVYGKRNSVPFRETDDLTYGPTTHSRWSYACTKVLDEFMALAYWKAKRLPVVVARLFNAVGPRQTGRYGMVVPRFVSQALAGEPITVYGDGKQTRCFTYVKDTTEALVRLMDCREAEGEVVNVGSDDEITIEQLAHQVAILANSSSELRLIPYAAVYPTDFEDMQRRVPALDKLERLTGLQPRTPLDTILQSVIDYQRAHSE
jgi:nucleoside-diphosphate-sugar epimerase